MEALLKLSKGRKLKKEHRTHYSPYTPKQTSAPFDGLDTREKLCHAGMPLQSTGELTKFTKLLFLITASRLIIDEKQKRHLLNLSVAFFVIRGRKRDTQ